MEAVGGFSSKIYLSILDIPKEDWDSIFPSIVENYDFVKTTEETFSHAYKFFYITVYKESEIVLIAPCFIADYALDTTIKGNLKSITAWIKKIIPGFLALRVLISGNPASCGHLGVKPIYQSDAIPLFDLTMRKLAQQERASIIGFKDFGEEYTHFLDFLKDVGFHKARSFPCVRLKTQFKSFEDYLHSLSKTTRKGLRRKFHKTENLPITMKVQNSLGIWLDEAYGLYCQTLHKSEIQFEIVPKEFFEHIASNCPQEAKFFLWFLNEKLVAFELCLARDGIMIDKYLGLDYEVAYQYHLYFLTYRDIFNWCLINDIEIYEGGALNYSPKKNLDFAFSPQYIYCRHQNPFLNVFLGILCKILPPENFDPVIKTMYQNLPAKDKKKSSSNSVYWLILLTVIIQTLSELLFKTAALATHMHVITMVNLESYVHLLSCHIELWAGLMFYVLNFFVWITVLSKADLSFAFPLGSICYILIPLLSVIFLHEQTNLMEWAGIILITIGISLVIQSNNRRRIQ